MDKRWLGILIILIAGLACMYYIVDNSSTVGNAITVVGDVSIGVPPGFSIADASATEAKLLNKDTHETILLKIIDKNPQKEFENAVKSFQNNNNAELKNLSNKTVQHIEFKDTDSGKTTSFVFFEKVNHSFMLKMDNFNNSAQKEKDMMHIINTITHDFKQNK